MNLDNNENFHDSYDIDFYINKDISINTEKNIKILYLNIRSIQNKLCDLECLIDKYSCNVVVVSESWLNNSNKMFFNVKGFRSVHSVRSMGPDDCCVRGGGVSMFISDTIKFNLLYEHADMYNNILGVDLFDLKIKIFGIYRSNDTYNNSISQIEIFLKYIDHITREFKNSIIVGDFNFNLLEVTQTILKYLSIINSNNYSLLNKIDKTMITRSTNGHHGSIIDHIISDIFQFKYIFSILENSISDHNLIILGTNNNKIISCNKTITKTNYQNIILDIYSTDFTNINTANELQNCLNNIIKKNTMEKNVKKNRRIIKPYITNDIITMINRREKLFKLTKKYPNSLIIRELLNKMRNKISNLCKIKKKEYYDNIVNENYNNPRKLWSIINEVLYNKSNNNNLILPSKIEIDGSIITNKTDILNALNYSFVTAGKSNFTFSPDHSLNTDLYLPQLFAENNFTFKQLTVESIKSIFKRMNKNSAAGIDLIRPKLLNTILPKINIPILNIINNTFRESIFPQSLKEARILPLYKSGDKNNQNNYRSLSILPSISKPLEIAMNDQIMDFVVQKHIISNNQYGFVPDSNTASACVTVVSEIQTSLDRKMITACLAIDLRKAFDSINHAILLCKLRKYDFSVDAINLIESYLTNRIQKIVLDDTFSNTEVVTMGVPQGSILGPTLFNLYINDVFELNLFGGMSMYADDAMLTYSAASLTEVQYFMQKDLETLNSYFINNSLQINILKTNYMIFGKYSDNILNLTINQTPITKVESMKYLGLMINSKLTWVQHADNVIKNISPYCGVLYKLNKILDKNILMNIYYAHINSRLLYLNIIWSSIPHYKQKEINILQNKSIKAIMSLPRLTPTHLLYNEKILPFEMLSKYELIVIIYKIINNKIKHNINLIRNTDIHDHNTRYSSQLHIDINNTQRFGTNSFLNRGKTIYNNIPDELKNISNTQQFKSQLKQYLMS